MNIIIDGFGGDKVPDQVLLGAADAVRAYGVEITITGDENLLAQCAAENNIPLDGIRFVHAPSIIPMDEEPRKILKEYADSSMATGLRLLAEDKGDAFVSGGSTGALLMGATFYVKRIKDIRRPAIASLIPTGSGKPYLLIDLGANQDCRAEMLVQFAVMGSIYCKSLLGLQNPRVGLVNIGSEANKGDDLRKETYSLLEKASGVNFIGNIEARQLPGGGCDVAVCDGFTGNIILKLSEGFGDFFSGALRTMFTTNIGTKLSALLLKKQLRAFKGSLNYKEYGGAPFLGVRYPVIKAHGSSDAFAFQNAIRQAIICREKEITARIEEGIAALEGKEELDDRT
jgi:glycerol-3-phosphate acyltransferase PlsX